MNLIDALQQIDTFVFDVDGVLTDGSVLLVENGLQARRMHVRDGLALQMALRAGYRVLIISGAHSEPVVRRFEYLGLSEIHTAIKDKKAFLLDYLDKNGLSANSMLCMGDDLPDLSMLQLAGVAACPADAAGEIKNISHFISTINGGNGCVREVIEKVLRIQGRWNFESEITAR